MMFRFPRRFWAVCATASGVLAAGLSLGRHSAAGPPQEPAAKTARTAAGPLSVGAVEKSFAAKVPVGVQGILEKLHQEHPKGKFGFTPFAQKMLLRGLKRTSSTTTAGGMALSVGASADGSFPDLTTDQARQLIRQEVRALAGLQLPPNIGQLRKARALAVGATGTVLAPAAPAGTENQKQFDFRSMSYISKAADQGGCGACWAFSSVGAFEAVTRIYNPNNPPELIKLSEQYVLNNTPADAQWPGLIPNNCDKGFWGDALDVMRSGVPVVDLSLQNPADPWIYTGTQGNPQPLSNLQFKVADWGFVGSDSSTIPDPTLIKAALCQHGPIIAGIFSSTDGFIHLQGNVLQDDTIYPSPDHAIVIIGWMDYNDGDRTHGAWLIKNSWGAGWGFGGFGYIDYSSNLIGIQATYVVPAIIGGG